MTAGDLAASRVVRNAFIVRVVAVLLIHYFVTPWLFAPDEETYDYLGNYLAQYWRGEVPSNPFEGSGGEPTGYYYIVAVLYLPFGQFPLLPKLLNAGIGSLAVLELFRLARLIGGSERAALRAATLMAFFPSMILWSSVMVRDVWVQWLLVRMAREMAELKGRVVLKRMLSVVVLIWALTQFRSYLLYAAVGPFLLSFVLSRTKDIGRNIILGSVLALALAYFGVRGGTSGRVQAFDLEELQRLRSWSSSAAAADSGFAPSADISTFAGAMSVLPTGLLYFYFAPFPWQTGSMSKVMAIPETVLFYTLVPGILVGIGFLFRKRLADSIGVLLVTMTVTFGYAIGQGNVGTLYRHKAQVMGFYYAFAAIGVEKLRRRAVAAPDSAPLHSPWGALRDGPVPAVSGHQTARIFNQQWSPMVENDIIIRAKGASGDLLGGRKEKVTDHGPNPLTSVVPCPVLALWSDEWRPVVTRGRVPSLRPGRPAVTVPPFLGSADTRLLAANLRDLSEEEGVGSDHRLRTAVRETHTPGVSDG